MFLAVLLSLVLMGLYWWGRLNWGFKSFRHGTLWRSLVAVFAAWMLVVPILSTRMAHFLPPAIPAAGFLWHLLILPPVIAIMLLVEGYLLARRRFRPDARTDLSRRRFLTAAAIAPPLLAGGLTAVAAEQVGKFRVRNQDIALDGWPAELNGFTIAMVADVHTGPFSTPQMLADIVARTNTIHQGGPADLVVLGGDLINTTLDDLPEALDMATALRGRVGTVAILGNHDVMDDWRRFADAVNLTGIALLMDARLTIEPKPGIKVDLLGARWRVGDEYLYQSIQRVAALREASNFPICLAHHPHAWDEAIRQGLPLTLSAHTHGGQIMLTDTIGAGPLKFRYWTGVHRRQGSTLVISNGVGNWFPLRVNAPAEILKITLSKA